MTVEELYDFCGNWLPNTAVSVCSKSTGMIETFTYYRKVLELYGDKSVANFCWFPGVFAINLR
jgi:hypothetical protein